MATVKMIPCHRGSLNKTAICNWVSMILRGVLKASRGLPCLEDAVSVIACLSLAECCTTSVSCDRRFCERILLGRVSNLNTEHVLHCYMSRYFAFNFPTFNICRKEISTKKIGGGKGKILFLIFFFYYIQTAFLQHSGDCSQTK